jgi:acyl carrier protein
MGQDELRTRVKQVIARVLKIDAGTIGDEANFIFDLGADSMQSVQLVAAFEEEFGLEMEQDKALSVQSVAGAVAFIAQALAR